jgi:hypothetical protein
MKKKAKGVLAVALAMASIHSLPANAVDHVQKRVLYLQSTSDTVDCFFFVLESVGQADPVKPGDQWFAFPRSQYGSKDAYAMLLAAKLTGATVTVHTNGQMACGYASAARIMME